MLQIDRQTFLEALIELGHDPIFFEDMELSTTEASIYFGLPEVVFTEAIEDGEILQSLSGDVSLIDAAWLHYCYKSEADIMSKLKRLAN